MRRIMILVASAIIAAGCSADDDPPVGGEVPADQIIFDTFDGRSVALSDADDATIARLLDAIPPIDDPTYESPSDADWLSHDDVVLGYIDANGDAWAFPVKILDLHEIVNDEIAGEPLLISYCPLCGSGVVYGRVLNGEELFFSNTSALYENDLVMSDRETGSYWWQVAGRALRGELTGQVLPLRSAEMARWIDWQERHPDTLVLARPTELDYERSRFSTYGEFVDGGSTPFPVNDSALDDERLPSSTPTIVVELGGRTIAFAATPASSSSVTIDDREYEIVTTGVGGTITDVASGQLIPARTAMWFAVVSAYPEVELRG